MTTMTDHFFEFMFERGGDPFADSGSTPANWDLSDLPAPVRLSLNGYHPQDPAEGDPDQAEELPSRASRYLSEFHFGAYFDADPQTPGNDKSAF